MRVGKVIGQLVACEVYIGMEGMPLLWVQPLDKTGKAKGKPTVMVDSTRMAGSDEIVFYEGGREAALLLDPWFVPVDYAIAGIVDDFYTDPSAKRKGARS